MRKFIIAFVCFGAFVGFLFKGFSPVLPLESEISPGAASPLVYSDREENVQSDAEFQKVSATDSVYVHGLDNKAKAKRLPMDRKEAAKRWDAISKLVACSYGAACSYVLPDAQARDSFFAARDGIVKQIEWFLHREPSKEDLGRSIKAAQGLLSFQDEQVQESAMKWILSMPSNPDTLRMIQEDLRDAIDPDLVGLLVLELRRQMDLGHENAVLEFVESMLFEGSIMASREMARSAPILITEANRHRFERWAGQLPINALKTQLLREALARGKVAERSKAASI
jgi:hypothetical protein